VKVNMISKNDNLKRNGYRAVDISELERMQQPGYRRINRGLMPDATLTDKAKYEICQSILRYKQGNNLSEKEVGKKLGIKKTSDLEYLLFCHIDNFDLDELAEYARKLLGSFELKVVRPGEEVHFVSQSKSNSRRKAL
jgi:hypothetical protein